ncbi:MAG TPA: acyltransferase, partial [Rhodopila sp.]|nr:acyltransferase [Rhodopila sp.]
MASSYPMASIAMGALAAFIMATCVGTVLARVGFPVTPAERRLGCVDGLRGYLALSVLVHHFVVWLQVTRLGGTWSPPAVNILNNIGAGSVALFFMITGFVFYPRVLNGFVRNAWPAICVGRIFRIVPLIIVSVCIIIGIIAWRGRASVDGSLPSALLQWITSWGEPPLLGYPDTGRLNAYVLWSLWYEWLFYLLILPACALVMDLIRGRLPSWLLPLALWAAAPAAERFHLLGELHRFMPLFAIGMLAYECRKRSRIRQLLASRWMGIVAILALLIGLNSAPTPYGLVPMLLCGVFFVAVTCGNDLYGLLCAPGALVLGDCSYGIYLLHGVVLSLLLVDAAPVTGLLTTRQLPALLPIAAFAVVCTTAVTFLLIERPAIWAGRRL